MRPSPMRSLPRLFWVSTPMNSHAGNRNVLFVLKHFVAVFRSILLQSSFNKETTMYGTVCRFQLKPGMEAQLAKVTGEFEAVTIMGERAEIVYQMDNNPNEYIMVVVFDSEEAYKRNAASPDQDVRYRMFREILAAEPEWNDGQIVYSRMSERV